MSKIKIFLMVLLFTLPLFSQSLNPGKLKQIDSLLSSTYREGNPGAVVLISLKNQILFNKSFGISDIGNKQPITNDMLFETGSHTKKFVSTAILYLSEKGKLSIKESVSKYISLFPDKWANISIENLLSHTSGIPDFFSIPAWYGLWGKSLSPVQLFGLIKEKDLLFNPGEGEQYSNSNYLILALIIEKITNMSYEKFLKDTFFLPLKMKNTHFVTETGLKNIAAGYLSDGLGGFSPPPYVHPSHYFGSGSLVSNANDLQLFTNALTNGKIIKKETLTNAFKPFILKNGKPSLYSLMGFPDQYLTGKKESMLFTGTSMGFKMAEKYYPEDNLDIIILSNSSPQRSAPDLYDPLKISRKIGKIIFGISLPNINALTLSDEELDKYTGQFRINNNEVRTITRAGKKIFVKRGSSSPFEIIPVSKTEFFAKDNEDLRCRFRFDNSGNLVGFLLDNGGRSEPVEEVFIGRENNVSQPNAYKLTDADYDALCGSYFTENNFEFKITKGVTGVIVSGTGRSPAEFSAETNLKFHLASPPADIVFIPDQSGKITGLSFSAQNGRFKMTAKKAL